MYVSVLHQQPTKSKFNPEKQDTIKKGELAVLMDV
jgi:hypothetical protein